MTVFDYGIVVIDWYLWQLCSYDNMGAVMTCWEGGREGGRMPMCELCSDPIGECRSVHSLLNADILAHYQVCELSPNGL